MVEIIIVPGIGGSGELHWQTRWEGANPQWRRLQSTDWNQPELDDWIAALDRAVGAARQAPLLVAHSLGCLLVAHWQQVSTAPVAGAFLVAVPNPEAPAFPVEAAGFANPPRTEFRFPSLIVASADDPYGTVEYARERANQWGGGIVEVGELGHINETSKLADWPQGKALFAAFAAGTAS
ncbi:alpha/beta hydrolase [Bradyrhizobium sp. JYMT SZCCT0428]|uniref:RBBP9/YdeN family alpha/beta hydrolase n=1 Tax=Bradyrhizobium sp. JYMT SZCCT0428 TaxID=2807673 RepID=UPI001BAC8035|nr:alpha/beta hydrolase [Bradyrhizobium sp. JYMT SZCCT0428]MBR1154851.1 serine hydrolase family protein [Bradyrhizobium sp. JYMT SZCCT0428]